MCHYRTLWNIMSETKQQFETDVMINYKSQNSVVTHLKCGGIFSAVISTDLLLSLSCHIHILSHSVAFSVWKLWNCEYLCQWIKQCPHHWMSTFSATTLTGWIFHRSLSYKAVCFVQFLSMAIYGTQMFYKVMWQHVWSVMFNNHCHANLLEKLTMKELWKLI